MNSAYIYPACTLTPQLHADLRVAWDLLRKNDYQAAADRVFGFLNGTELSQPQEVIDAYIALSPDAQQEALRYMKAFALLSPA